MLHFIKIGTGPRVMIGFHGLGRDATMFQRYQNMFPEFTIYSVSLFYHGSNWKDQRAGLDDKQWKAMFGYFLLSEGVQNFSMLGFSLGGKVALYTFQLFSDRVDEIHLIAPYGIKANVVEFITQRLPFVYRRLERYVHHPAALLSLLEIFRRYKLLNTTLVNITINQMSSQEARARVFYTMRLYGTLRLDLRSIRKKLEASKVPVVFYLGLYDKILTIKALNRYLSALIDASLHVMPSGHSRLPDLVARTFGEKVEHALN
ncbi:MAG: alpha/beta hydrolase [Tunicatimonas sp.]